MQPKPRAGFCPKQRVLALVFYWANYWLNQFNAWVTFWQKQLGFGGLRRSSELILCLDFAGLRSSASATMCPWLRLTESNSLSRLSGSRLLSLCRGQVFCYRLRKEIPSNSFLSGPTRLVVESFGRWHPVLIRRFFERCFILMDVIILLGFSVPLGGQL